MAKFIYRMQSILELKKKLEEQEKINFSITNARLKEEEEKFQKLMFKKAGYDAKAQQLVKGAINLQEIATNRKAIEAMKVIVRAQMMEVHRAQKDVEKARKKLTEVMQERKMHEKLREKAFEEFVQELDHEERQAVDELVSYTYNDM